MTNEEIVFKLAQFLRDETLEECPIMVTSRQDIKGEDAELVRFTFGEYKESCIAVVYADGTTYTPTDWETPIWDSEDWDIEKSNWMDCDFNECINFLGLPRRLV